MYREGNVHGINSQYLHEQLLNGESRLKRPYKNRQGQWEHGSYNLKQPEALIELAQQAIRFITESEQTKNAEQESAPA